MELAQQLGVILIGKQAIGNVQELVIPKLKGFVQRMKRRKKRKGEQEEEEEEEKPWEKDYALVPNEGLFQVRAVKRRLVKSSQPLPARKFRV